MQNHLFTHIYICKSKYSNIPSASGVLYRKTHIVSWGIMQQKVLLEGHFGEYKGVYMYRQKFRFCFFMCVNRYFSRAIYT